MDRTRSLLRRTYVFGGVAVLSLAVVVLRATREVESRTVEHLPLTFPAIDVDKEVRRVEVERAVKKDGKPVEESVRLERTGLTTWVLTSSSGYPADAKKVEDALKDLAKVKTRSVPTTNPAKFTEFADKEEGFINVRLYGDGEDPILSFGVGRNNAEGSYSNVFLRVDDVGAAAGKGGRGMKPTGPEVAPGGAGVEPGKSGKIVTATGIETYAWRDRAQVTPWIESRLFPGLSENDVMDVSWSHPPKQFAGVLVRAEKPTKDPKDPNAPKDPKDAHGPHEAEDGFSLSLPDGAPSAAKKDPAKQFFQSVSGLRMAGLEGLAGADADAKFGFDKPDIIVTAKGKPPKEGANPPFWKVEIGKKVEGKSSYYARRVTGGADKGGVDKWVFTVEDYELSRFRDDPKDLLEKKPEEKKPEPPPTPAEPAMGDPAMTEPAMGEPAMAEPAMGEPAMSEPAMGDAVPPAMEEPAMGDAAPPAMGEPAMEEPAMGDASGK